MLLTVNGVGPRTALNVLSSLPVAAFCTAVAQGDVKALTRINGIGKRSAERLVVELRDRVAEIAPEAGIERPGAGPARASREALDAMVGALVSKATCSGVSRLSVSTKPYVNRSAALRDQLGMRTHTYAPTVIRATNTREDLATLRPSARSSAGSQSAPIVWATERNEPWGICSSAARAEEPGIVAASRRQKLTGR